MRCKLAHFLKNTSGFLLIEAALALLILGALLGIGLPQLTSYLATQKRVKTIEKQEQLFYSVANFFLTHRYIPLPANPHAPCTEFGFSRQTVTSPEDLRGIVPFKTLNLPESYAKDGYNNYFTYVGGWPEQQKFPTRQMPLFALSLNHVSSPQISLLIISHGSKGHGAYQKARARLKQYLPPQMTPNERTNSQGLDFIEEQPSFSSQSFFDQTIFWTTTANLSALYGKTPLFKLMPANPGAFDDTNEGVA